MHAALSLKSSLFRTSRTPGVFSMRASRQCPRKAAYHTLATH